MYRLGTSGEAAGLHPKKSRNIWDLLGSGVEAKVFQIIDNDEEWN